MGGNKVDLLICSLDYIFTVLSRLLGLNLLNDLLTPEQITGLDLEI